MFDLTVLKLAIVTRVQTINERFKFMKLNSACRLC